MISSRRRSIFILVSLASLVVLILLVWPQSQRTAFPLLPQPNGYDALVQVAATLQRPSDSAKVSSFEQLDELSAKNQKALAALREALKLQCAVPVQMSGNWLTIHSAEIETLSEAAFALGTEAKVQLRRGDTNGAIHTYFDLMQLSSAIGKGGVLTDFLMSAACERFATERFPALIPGFDVAHCKEVVKFLQAFDEQRDSFEEIQKRENEWARKSRSVPEGILMGIQERLSPNGRWGALILNEYASTVQAARNAALQAAVRVYRLERGKAPDQVSDLIPAYLSRVPINPTTGHPLELPSSNQ